MKIASISAEHYVVVTARSTTLRQSQSRASQPVHDAHQNAITSATMGATHPPTAKFAIREAARKRA
jgi:hypothetical protein